MKHQRVKILVVDDDVVLLNTLLAKLTLDDFFVQGSMNGQDALSKIESFKPDILVLDLVLPDIDGFTLLEKIRMDEKTKELPVVVCTNRDDKEVLARCKEFKVRECLLKVRYRLDELVKRIADIANELKK